jgi:hypothetical protein
MKAPSFLTRHPASVGETYGQHFASASGFGLRLIAAGCACLVHALLPFLLQRTASRIVAALHTRMVTARSRPSAIPDAGGSVSAR